jgi:hypothetical protein
MAETRFEPRISLGNLLSIVTLLVAIFVSWASLSASQARTEQRIADLEFRLARTEGDHDIVMQMQADLKILADKSADDARAQVRSR